MRQVYVAAMERLYRLCMWIACASIVTMTVLIAVGVFSRYILSMGAFFAEPISIFLAIQMTFYGGAACYRAGAHLRLEMMERALPPATARQLGVLIELLMGGISAFMLGYGLILVKTTINQVYPEFEFMRVGVVYTAIPIGGAVTLLFVIERLLFGPPPGEAVPAEESV